MVCFDFDGVFTDCMFTLFNNGESCKSYNGRDNYGIKILKEHGLIVGIITADTTSDKFYDHMKERNHFNKLDFFEKRVTEKLKVLDSWRQKHNLEWIEIAYMGDDLQDLQCLRNVGLPACPHDACREVNDYCKEAGFVSQFSGGHGSVRNFIEYMFDNNFISQK